MKKVMGIDLGEKRIGVAMAEGDELSRMMAFPKFTFSSWKELFAFIEDQEMKLIVIGWPLEMDGSEGRATRKVDKFLERLFKVIENEELEVVRWDERLTSVGGVVLLREAGVNAKAQRKILDQVAATQILQSYLDSFKA